VVKILDERGREVPRGERGRIFVGNSVLFEGYSGGGHKEVVDGLMSSGDVGRVDAAGRLFVEGRDDDMIVSGGENVFPGEIEDCLSRHPGVVDVAVVGVPDPDFGQRLRAVVVAEPGVTDTELKDWVRGHLARFKVPREVVLTDRLPRNATGKILRSRL
jgi:fatty-acyl-CoA synthase